MSVWKCPHCGSAHLIVGGEPLTERCIKAGCGGITLRQETEHEAAVAVSSALLAHDHLAEIPPLIKAMGRR